MSRVLQRATAMVALMASAVFATTLLAQMPTSPWKKGAPFPEPDEELYSVPANGKMYVIGGWGDGKARGVNYEYDPATDMWRKKSPMPHPAHHAALAAVNGKIYAFGGFVAPANNAIPLGAAWEPIADAYEVDAANVEILSWSPNYQARFRSPHLSLHSGVFDADAIDVLNRSRGRNPVFRT